MIGSACDGGLADEPDGMWSSFYDATWGIILTFPMPEIPSPYNRPGSLSVWSDDSLAILDGHMRRGDSIRIGLVYQMLQLLLGQQPKHYTINDIKFDPTRQALSIFWYSAFHI